MGEDMKKNTLGLVIFDIALLSVTASGCAVAFALNSWLAIMMLLIVVLLFAAFCIRYPSVSDPVVARLSPVIAFCIAVMTVWLSHIDSLSVIGVYGVIFAIVFGVSLYFSRRSVIGKLPRE